MSSCKKDNNKKIAFFRFLDRWGVLGGVFFLFISIQSVVYLFEHKVCDIKTFIIIGAIIALCAVCFIVLYLLCKNAYQKLNGTQAPKK